MIQIGAFKPAIPTIPKPNRFGKGVVVIYKSLLILIAGLGISRSDETCMSPYLPKIQGQEEFVYVWTLGVEGWGDGSDKLVTIDVRPYSPTVGQVLHTVSVGGRHEAHHGGFTDDRRQLWLGGLDTSRIFIFDVATDPSQPRWIKTIDDFTEQTGAVGPHGMYAMPGRMLIPCLSNPIDHGGRSALVEFSNEGRHLRTEWLPTEEDRRGAEVDQTADGYCYDARVLPRKNIMLTSSFTGKANYMRPFDELTEDPEAMKHFGRTLVLWDLHRFKPKRVFHVPGAPLEVRWALKPNHNYAFTTTALGSKIWLIYEDRDGVWSAKEVGHIGPEGQGVLPVDISLSADDRLLFIGCFADGTCRVFDVSDPHRPRLVHEKKIGGQVNMVSQSWDGNRVYFTSSLLSRWDKTGDENDPFFKAYTWDGKTLEKRFEIDFKRAQLGRPHIMRFGSSSLFY